MENTTGKFLAGYAIKDITPDYPVPLAGFGQSWLRMSERIFDHLFVQCAAFVDPEGEALLLFTYDNVKVNTKFYESAADYFEEKYGIDRAHFHINASHSESSPDTYVDMEKCPEMRSYNELVVREIMAAGDEAIRNLKPASLEYATTRTWNLNFVKHAYLDTGVAIGDNHGRPSDGVVLQHPSKVDNAMLAVKVIREGEPDIVLINWRAHNQFTSGGKKTDLSADYVGAFRDAAKEKFGCNLMFFQGCAGNVNPYSYIRAEERTRDYVEFGKFLAQHLNDVYDHMTPIEAGKIKAHRFIVTAKTNHDEDYRIEEARRISKLFSDGVDRKECREEAIRSGFSSVYHANSIVRNYSLPETMDYPLSVCSIGDIGFAMAEFEIFDNLGVFVRENSPFAQTFVMGYTDHASSYMPSAYAYQYGCYEAENSRLAIGSGERCAALMLESLIRLKYHYGE